MKPPQTLVIEIGCEEIPARMLRAAADDFAALVVKALDDAGLAHGPARSFWTPRRLAVRVPECVLRTPEREELLLGPPAAAAWDAAGAPGKALLGFARKHGLDPACFSRRETDKGVYAATTVQRGGESVGAVLAAGLPGAVAAMAFPKTMRWGDGRRRFVRPVHWVVALAGEETLDLEFLGVAAGRMTRGRRAFAPGLHEIPSADAWEETLAQLGVVVDPQRRRDLLRAALAQAAAAQGGRPVEDEELLEESADIVEHPGALCGVFDERFVRELPAEVLQTCLRHHQKAFLVVDDKGPRPVFAVAVNVAGDPEGHVRRGHEWVVGGRLADALFFWSDDRKRPLSDRVAALDGVVFQQDLGSYAAKTVRVRRLAGLLADAAHADGGAKAALDRAAFLARADLVTGLVGEFPELQGVVGGLLARADGEPEAAADAAYHLYAPGSPDGPLPERETALLLGVADRLDTLAGAFAVGLAPSGSKDPFALRRAGAVLVRLARRLPWLDLAWGARASLDGFTGGESGPELRAQANEVVPQLMDFLFERFAGAAARWIPGVRYDEINAVRSFARTTFVAADLYERIHGLQGFRTSDDFYALALASKRARNILAQAKERGEEPAPLGARAGLTLNAEKGLLAEMDTVGRAVEAACRTRQYGEALSGLASLRPAVDRFFDDVLVMDPDADKRRARLGLLAELHALTHRVVDLSEIVVEGSEREARRPAGEGA